MKTETKWDLREQQHWDRALSQWDGLGFHSKVFYLSCHLKAESRRKGKPISGNEAYLLARNEVERQIHEKDPQLKLAGLV